jgi:hypothetical protein
MFGSPVHDVYCGLRGFRKGFYKELDQRFTGMEFATEMIIKASLFGAMTTEVPITLYPDGRKSHTPHLRTFHASGGPRVTLTALGFQTSFAVSSSVSWACAAAD